MPYFYLGNIFFFLAQPVVVDKVFAECLKRYAALIAKFVLGKRSAGTNLSDDIKVRIKNS